MDLSAFAAEVGDHDPVGVTGLGSRGGPPHGVRVVRPPDGVERIEPAEMTVSCGAGTPVNDLCAALAVHGQTVNVPAGGTVGGALSVGHSDHRLLGYGPMRDVLLHMHYVSAAGLVVKAGGPTVKNVSGFDLCRLFVGARGTLGFLGDVILRTRPLPKASQWFTTRQPPDQLLAGLFRPVSLLWDGDTLSVLLEGHPADIERQAATHALEPAAAMPELPAHRVRHRPEATPTPGRYVVAVGTGAAYAAEPVDRVLPAPRVAELERAVKDRFDPFGRLNPGVPV